MYSLNQVQLIGRAGHEPELYTLTDGTRRCRLRLYQNPSERSAVPSPLVHRLVAWDDTADRLYAAVRRGDRVFVQGHLNYRKFSWEGQQRDRTEVVVRQFAVLAPHHVPGALAVAEPAPNSGQGE